MSILKITWGYSKKSCVYKIMRTKCGTPWSPISRLKNLNKTNFCSLSPQSVLFCYKTSNKIIPEIILISLDKQNKILSNFEMQPTLIISMDFYSFLKESIPKSSISTLAPFCSTVQDVLSDLQVFRFFKSHWVVHLPILCTTTQEDTRARPYNQTHKCLSHKTGIWTLKIKLDYK